MNERLAELQSFDLRWLPFRNDSSETVPAHAVLKITGATRGEDRRTLFTIDKPGGSTFTRLYGVNGATPVAVGRYGALSFAGPLCVLYEGGPPAIGEGWGPKPGSWKLAKAHYGFTIAGGVNTEKEIVLATLEPIVEVEGKSSGSISADGTGTVDVWTGESPGADTTWDLTAWNRYDTVTAISSGKRVGCTWTGNVWVVRAAQCES
jgi:hypothetical protein